MVIKKTIKKEDIKEMPKVLFPGQVALPNASSSEKWSLMDRMFYLYP